MKYRKKPVVIEAIQFLGDENVNAVAKFVGDPDEYGKADFYDIETLEGTMTARPGDWIIRGVQGEFYPCKPDIFEATYEAVEA